MTVAGQLYYFMTYAKQSLYTPWWRLGERYSSYSFLTSALDGGWVVSVTSRPRFTPGERTPGTHCTGGWVGPRAGLDTQARGKILCPCRGSNTIRTELPWLVYDLILLMLFSRDSTWRGMEFRRHKSNLFPPISASAIAKTLVRHSAFHRLLTGYKVNVNN
jgi:hypothetical protein